MLQVHGTCSLLWMSSKCRQTEGFAACREKRQVVQVAGKILSRWLVMS
jgi:hypothetical protein